MMDYRVEKRFSPHGDVEGDVQVGLVAASVVLHVSNGWHLASRFLNSFALGKYFFASGTGFCDPHSTVIKVKIKVKITSKISHSTDM